MPTAYVALGSNLGDRASYLLEALARLSLLPRTRLLRVSHVYETEPLGPPQPRYLNQAAEVWTDLRPEELLEAFLEVEASLGRTRRERWGPRTIDLDLLLYEDLVLSTPNLTLPHPRLHERPFVLAPLCDLIPDGVHPLLGQTYRTLLEGLGTRGVRRVL
ncbi:MAG: 2-amino-4-hydroxy-6-hydroxymethyldihydropteridine diphosphokinase [Thermaceae bacterium]